MEPMFDAPDLPDFLTAEEFLDWPPSSRAKERWHLLDGGPVRMPTLGAEQSMLFKEASYVISAHLHHEDSDARVGTMVAVNPMASPRKLQGAFADRNIYVAAIGVTYAPPADARIMPDPVLLVEIITPENFRLVRVGVAACKLVPSVQEILVLDGLHVCAALHRRNASGGWDDPENVFRDECLDMRSIGIKVPINRLYQCVDLGKESLVGDKKQPLHPGRIIQDRYLAPLCMSVADAASHLGVRASYLADVVAGIDSINADLALRLAQAFGLSAWGWFRLQATWDMAQVPTQDIQVEPMLPGGGWDHSFASPGIDIGPRDQPSDQYRPYDDHYDVDGALRDKAAVAPYWCLAETNARGCHVWIPDLAGCSAQAATLPLALVELACAAEVWIARREATGRPVPPPRTADHLKQLAIVVLALSGGAEVRQVPVRTGRVATAVM